ncbi:MAG: hypothetical protein MJ198_10530 [Bacteroidales bacterium]|nr:hypothetical protein [Bacteroidales bacterium]
MYSNNIRERSKRRTNRNFYIITVGFICSLIFVIFGTQSMLVKIEKKNTKKLHCEIQNESNSQINTKLTVGDVIIYEDIISTGKTEFETKWFFDTTKSITASFNNQTAEFQNISIDDSISYLMIQLKPKKDNSIEIIGNFFE